MASRPTLAVETLDASSIASYIFAVLFLLMVLLDGLLGALFAGLLMFSLIRLMAPFLGRKISDVRARMIVAAAIGLILITGISMAVWGLTVLLKTDATSMSHLFQKMADIIDASRGQMPVWLSAHMPVDADSVRNMITSWLREHASDAQAMGAAAGKTLTRILIGMIIGVMVSLHDTLTPQYHRPFAAALLERVQILADAFRNIVFAQVWISGINTILSGVFILVVLPMADVSLPFSKSLIALTFVAGLLPVVGNLVSNTVLVVVALSHSLETALACLAFMVVLHKLEYFLNARIIGSKINARSWELLIAMLVGESLFGMTGVIAAPVFYAYAKKELTARGLI
ncbi:AI-2E family transporter [Massilia sp. TSP1-1-2]|uniref:AI-2E family transporter n=1 Tax=unclassified Massilia TaxID=2609279 RepID=UPI003CE6CFAD